MKNLTEMLKKAQEMQTKMGEMQAQLEDETVEGAAGAGLVKVVLNGKGDMKSLSIDPSLFTGEDKDVLEDLIIAAHTQARAKSQELMQSQMQSLTGGMPLPDGFKMPF